MRTTLTIEDRIARELKELAHRTGQPFKVVVKKTLRAGLSAKELTRAKRYRLRPAALGQALQGIDLDKALGLAASLEDEEIARNLDLRI